MRFYSIKIENLYVVTDSPIVINVGYWDVDTSTTPYTIDKYVTMLTDFDFIDVNDSLTKINNNTFMVNKEGSYSVQLVDNTLPTGGGIEIFTFYVYTKPYFINQMTLYNLINRELPKVYKSSNVLNNIDNVASAGLIKELYDYEYKLFWDTIESLGSGNKWNKDLEFTFFNAKNILNIVNHPAILLQTLSNVIYTTTTKIHDLAITFSKVVYAIYGNPVPVSIKLISGVWNITIYSLLDNTSWVLGDSVRSVLGSTTILGYRVSGSLYFIYLIISRLMPSNAKYTINLTNTSNFQPVGDNQFYNATVYSIKNNRPGFIPQPYDAFKFANFNNSFNIQGLYYASA